MKNEIQIPWEKWIENTIKMSRYYLPDDYFDDELDAWEDEEIATDERRLLGVDE